MPPFAAIRHFAFSFLACTAVLVLLWWGLWSFASAQYSRVIDGWADAGRAQGYEISYDNRRLFGFPRHIVLRFTNVNWKNTDNIIFHADDIDIGAMPWQWQVFDAKFKNHVEIAAPVDTDGHTLILGGQEGRAHVELDRDGFWRHCEISLNQAQFGQTPRYIVFADRLEASGDRPLTPPKDHTEVGLTLTGHAKNVTLPDAMPTPFGLHMAEANVALRVMGDVPDFRRRDSVDAWNKNNGSVEFDNLSLDWGPLKIGAKGTMGFDDDLQPEGAFSGSLSNHEQVMKALMDNNFIAKHDEGMLNSALSLFAKPSHLGRSHDIELPISVQLGGLFLGPVRIFTYPPIEWPQNPPPATPALPPTETPPAAAPTP